MVHYTRATLLASVSLAALLMTPSWGTAQDVPPPVTPLPLKPDAPSPSSIPTAGDLPGTPPGTPTTATAPNDEPASAVANDQEASTRAEESLPPPSYTLHSPAEEQESVVPGSLSSTGPNVDQPKHPPNRRLLTGGSALLVAPYLTSVIVAASKDWSGDHYLYYPVAGPWMFLARRDHDAGGKTLLVLDGILQDVGALSMLMSFMVPERKKSHRMASNRLSVLPRVSRERSISGQARGYSLGLQASGRF
jgi:hypothetical protein